MVNGRQLESIRIQCGLSVIDMCNIMGITEGDWRRIIKNKMRPNVYQLCLFITATEHPLDGIKKRR